MDKVQIYGENNQYITIELHNIYGIPDETSYLGGYEAEGIISIKSGGFFGSGDVWVSTGQLFELKNRIQEIYDRCSGEVILVTSGAEFEMNMKMEERGRVCIAGRYKESYASDNELTFSFESDQSYLVRTIEELNEIALKYGGMEGLRSQNK
ncbi:hypothetical protein NQ117_00030 [Paenibacillus sp. SC116]|uniref:WapI family immunity protein n=1 Tax=Paenibacillus sp. SC116 TaxID=2968986 RepID=UPI00215B475D|nr:hypothetical protein [Paenibacillus sp. SC116]MCR8842060.1 hypothetical protein [Paenibacillus sp. SC116]